MADCTRRGNPHALQHRLHGERVHHRRQHAHVVGGGALDAFRGARPGRGRCCRRRSRGTSACRRAPHRPRPRRCAPPFRCRCRSLRAHQGFAGNLQQNAGVFGGSLAILIRPRPTARPSASLHRRSRLSGPSRCPRPPHSARSRPPRWARQAPWTRSRPASQR